MASVAKMTREKGKERPVQPGEKPAVISQLTERVEDIECAQDFE